MRSTARTARGPRRAPARLVTPRSIGTPTSATSMSPNSPLPPAAAGSGVSIGAARNVATPANGHLRLSGSTKTCAATEANAGSKMSPPFALAYLRRRASRRSGSIRWVSRRLTLRNDRKCRSRRCERRDRASDSTALRAGGSMQPSCPTADAMWQTYGRAFRRATRPDRDRGPSNEIGVSHRQRADARRAGDSDRRLLPRPAAVSDGDRVGGDPVRDVVAAVRAPDAMAARTFRVGGIGPGAADYGHAC